MLAFMKSSLILTLLLLSTGCSSIARRVSDHPKYEYIFPGVTMDISEICGIDHMTPISNIYYCIDFPFSMIADTVLLPYDLCAGDTSKQDAFYKKTMR